MILLRELDDKVRLFCFQVLCFGLLYDILELGFFVPGGLLEAIHEIETLALHCFLKSCSG